MSKKVDKGGRPSLNFTESEVLAAIEGSRGIVSRVASKLGCDWSTADKYIKLYPSSAGAMNAAMQQLLDICEDKLHKAINLEDIGTIKWFLSKKGKDRGYGDEIAIPVTVETKAPVILDIHFRPPTDLPTATASPAQPKKRQPKES